MKQRGLLVFAAAGLMLMAAQTSAHHSFSAVFDRDKPAVFTGVVTKVEWTNPHAHFYIDVRGPNGSAVNWQFELASPNGLLRRGWTRTSLKPGDAVTVDAFLARDGSNYANAATVKLSDGRRVFAGSPVDGGAAQ
jgi:hypothetical protein